MIFMARRLPAPKNRYLLRQRRHPEQQVKPMRRPKTRIVQPLAPPVSVPFYIYLVRLLIGLLGASAIVGTTLSLIRPVPRQPLLTKSPPRAVPKILPSLSVIKKENIVLKQKLQALATKYPQLQLHLAVLNLSSGEYVDLQSASSLPAASAIKIPILIALFQQLDRQQLQLKELLTLEKIMVAIGSGEMNLQPVGSKFTVLDSATKMIVDSDNTATNLLIKRLGGQTKLNAQFRSWGLVTTTLKNPLPDFSGTNISSPRELALLLQKLDQGQILSAASRLQVLEILGKTKRHTMLPWGLKPQTKIAHKTGEIATLVTDVGLIELSSKQKYIVAAMVVRPSNSEQAKELIRQSSKLIYQEYAPLIKTPVVVQP
jgi:beta-lactamase class A